MREIEKVFGRLKHKPEDFVVEEMGDKWKCKISPEFDPMKKTHIPKEIRLGEQKDFIWCELEKKNVDHFSAMKRLSDKLDKSSHDIGYAGTKDRFALTVQRISIFRPDLEKLENFSDTQIILKRFKWAKRKIKLGYLDANHFTITVRDIDKTDAKKISNNIRKTPFFPNFFGPQRFGSLRNNNVEIGKLILKRDFENAIWKILTDTSDKERADITYARKKLLKEKDFKSAARYFPGNLRLEKQLLFYLAKKPTDFEGALKSSERKNILMLVNSVQSKIFNEILEIALEQGLDFTKKGHENCILPGYKTKLYDGPLGIIEAQVLKSHDLTLNDFDVKQIPFLRLKGSFRKAVTQITDLKLEIRDDEEFKGAKKITLEFTLPSGVYATTFLENFFEFEK